MRHWATYRLTFTAATFWLVAAAAVEATPTAGQVGERLGTLTLPFIANQGQVDAEVAYYAPTFAGTLFVNRRGALVYSLAGRDVAAPGTQDARRPPRGPGWTLVETFRGGKVRPAGQEPGVTGVSSFIGNDPTRWRGELPTYQQLGLGEVWPGVTVSLRARGRSAEKIFTVAPGTSVDRIRVRVGGAHGLRVDPSGALIARTGNGDVAFTPPVAYQERGGVRRAVPVAYRVTGREYRFTVGTYDRTRPLVIDPLLQSTYLGGSSDDGASALAIHPTTGDVYVAGQAFSANFPGTTGGAQPARGFAPDGFVARLDRTLTALTQATYLGGSDTDAATAVAIHPITGDIYVTGQAFSTDFPHTAGGAQPGGGGAFVARLDSTLTTLIQATYLGGSVSDYASTLAIHPTTGDVYVAGQAFSANFPGTTGGAQSASGGIPDAFVARLPATLTALTQATYLGGSGADWARALAIHPMTGDVYVAGQTSSTNFPGTTSGAQPASGGDYDGFVARLPATLTSLAQATYLGGTAGGDVFSPREGASALAIHPATGDVYVAGFAVSDPFPGTAGGAQPANAGTGDAFIARFLSSLTVLIQATFLGGTGRDEAFALAIHPTTGDLYVGGWTSSSDFPDTTGGAQAARVGPEQAFIARLPATLTSLTQATYLGGSAYDRATTLAIHPTTGDVYVAGKTSSTNFPGTTGGAQPASGGVDDAFVSYLTSTLKLVDGPDLAIAKTHSGNFSRGQVGASYTIGVSNLGGATTTGTVTVTDTLPAGLTGTALNGTGWNCTLGTLTCTRSGALTPGSNYPVITVTVTVDDNAPSSITNTATIAGGGDANPANNTAADPTTIIRFSDVPTGDPFFAWIEALAGAGITGGCALSPPQYCPGDGVTRGQMAVFLLRGVHGAAYKPPGASGIFADVPSTHPFVTWIEQLFADGITGGCGTSPLRYCPDEIVTRAEMAVFLLRSKHGTGYQPPAATGLFADVLPADLFAPWIEQLAREGITGGCATGPARYCPDQPVTRGQMAVFLVRAFDLPM